MECSTEHTFKRDYNNFLSAIPAPLLNLIEGADEDTGINHDYICILLPFIFCRRTIRARAGGSVSVEIFVSILRRRYCHSFYLRLRNFDGGRIRTSFSTSNSRIFWIWPVPRSRSI